MVDSLASSLKDLPLTRLAQVAGVVGQVLAAGEGMRLGQSAVLSTKVHAFASRRPEFVQIFNADAGKVLYNRSNSGEICHLDIFHQCAQVDHRFVAYYVYQAIGKYNSLADRQIELACAGIVNPDFVDIQTAVGGGRITGSLHGGQKLSLRRVHENHVHIALRLTAIDYMCLFYIVAAVEAALADQGVELRCNEGIFYVDSPEFQAELSSYSDQTDSLLVGRQLATENCQAGSQTGNLASQEVGSRQTDNQGGNTFTGSQQAFSGGGQNIISVVAPAIDVPLSGKQQPTILTTSPAFDGYAPGLAESLRKATANINNQGRPGNKTLIWNSRQIAEKIVEKNDFSVGIDAAATVRAAAVRKMASSIQERLYVIPDDIRYTACRVHQGSDICLVVDSSGSMGGNKLQVAKYLAGEICRHGCSRLSLVTFQDKRAEVLRPFTKSKQAVLDLFDTIIPTGATPLAMGLQHSLAYLTAQMPQNPLLVLITDGIPSFRYGEMISSLQDALTAAAEIRQANCGFLGIGLDENNDFLKELAAAAGGSTYLFTDFINEI